MKFLQKLTNERSARSAARFMQLACYLLIGFFALCTILSFMGRQSFFLHTSTENFKNAIYAEEDHDPPSRGMTVHMGGDDVHVWTGDSDRIDPAAQAGLSLMYAVHTVPIMLAFWFLSRVFSNIHKGRIFTEENSACLLYYGLLQLAVAVLVPLIKLLICWIVNRASYNRLSIATGQAMLNTLIPGIAFIVAAYIIHYGVHLQDEVDHTL